MGLDYLGRLELFVLLLSAAWTWMMLTETLARSSGLIFVDVMKTFSVGPSSSILLCVGFATLFLFSGPLAGVLVDRVNDVRGIVGYGVLFTVTGWLLVYWSTDMTMIVGGFCFVGHGFAFIDNAIISRVSVYFDKHLDFASGMVVSGTSMGGIIGPLGYYHASRKYGFQGGCLLFFGSCALHVLVLAVLMRPVTPAAAIKPTTITRDVITSVSSFGQHENCADRSCTEIRGYRAVLLNRRFLLYVIAFFFSITGVFSSIMSLPALILQLGHTRATATLVLVTLGICELVSKVILGFVADKGHVNKTPLIIALNGFTAVLTAILLHVHGDARLYLLGAVIGLCGSSCFAFYPAMITEIVGRKDIGKGLGVEQLMIGISFITYPTVIGVIADNTNNYVYALYLSAGCLAAGAVPLVISWILERHLARTSGIMDFEIEDNNNNEVKEWSNVTLVKLDIVSSTL